MLRSSLSHSVIRSGGNCQTDLHRVFEFSTPSSDWGFARLARSEQEFLLKPAMVDRVTLWALVIDALPVSRTSATGR